MRLLRYNKELIQLGYHTVQLRDMRALGQCLRGSVAFLVHLLEIVLNMKEFRSLVLVESEAVVDNLFEFVINRGSAFAIILREG